MINREPDDLLPFYVNGTLDAAERDAVEQYLHDHPAARAQLKWYRSLHEHVRAEAPAVSSEIGLERTMQRIRAERPRGAAAPKAQRDDAPKGLAGRLRGAIAGLLAPNVLAPAFGVAVAVVALQAAWIANLGSADPATELRSTAGSVVAEKGPYLKVNFKSDAREADIRLLLVEVGGSLAGGPGQLGDWFVRVPGNTVDAAESKLRGSTIVDAVAVVDALPARP